MKIAVNTRFLIKDKLEGIGWFTYEIMQRVVQNHPEHEFIFFFDRKFPEEFIFSSNVQGVVLQPPARHPLLWYYWFERSIPKALKKYNADIFISPDGFLSLKAETKTLLTIHDLAWEHFPEYIPKRVRKYYSKYTPQYARKADRIVTVSEFSKNDISTKYGIESQKIDVVYNGVSRKYAPVNEQKKAEIQNKYTSGAPYFLFVSALQPRKNLIRLLQAFDSFKSANEGPVKLLVAGKHTWIKDEIEKTVEQMLHKEDVVFLGHLPQEQLAEIMGASLGMVYPSLFEGFGIPIIEAMHAEIPVITSEVSSMPEVAGHAALLIDPFSTDSIAGALQKIYKDVGLRTTLVKNGRIQREKFSWDLSAEKFWESIEKII